MALFKKSQGLDEKVLASQLWDFSMERTRNAIHEAIRREVNSWLVKHNLYISCEMLGSGAIYSLATTSGALALLTPWFPTEESLLAHLLVNREELESLIDFYKPTN